MTPNPREVTQLLRRWNDGDDSDRDRLLTLIYSDLKRIAAKVLDASNPQTLVPTVVVHEAFLRLVDQRAVKWQDRAHFFCITARLMRRIVIDYVRNRGASKRGGGIRPISLDDVEVIADQRIDLLELERALVALQSFDAEKAKLVELRFFAGLSLEKTAEVLNISRATVVRQWQMTKAWLRRELADGAPLT